MKQSQGSSFLLILGLVPQALCCETVTRLTVLTKFVTAQPSTTVAPSPVKTTPSSISTNLSPYLTISLSNVHGRQLSLSFGSNKGAPTPLNDPGATNLANASVTRYLFPTGWAGRVYVGPNLNPYGSKIEASYTGPPDVDVSYVDGYSVPITCSSEGVPVCGCNIELFQQSGISCDLLEDGPVCLNPAQNIPYGPAPPFFAACAGSAYTFPYDDRANVGGLHRNVISCCIGTACARAPRQLSSSVKGCLKSASGGVHGNSQKTAIATSSSQ